MLNPLWKTVRHCLTINWQTIWWAESMTSRPPGLRVAKSSLRLVRLFLWLGGKYSQRKISKVLFDLQCNFLEIATKTCCAIFACFTIFAQNILVFLQICWILLLLLFWNADYNISNNQSSPSGVTKCLKTAQKAVYRHFGHFARGTVILDRAVGNPRWQEGPYQMQARFSPGFRCTFCKTECFTV